MLSIGYENLKDYNLVEQFNDHQKIRVTIYSDETTVRHIFEGSPSQLFLDRDTNILNYMMNEFFKVTIQ